MVQQHKSVVVVIAPHDSTDLFWNMAVTLARCASGPGHRTYLFTAGNRSTGLPREVKVTELHYDDEEQLVRKIWNKLEPYVFDGTAVRIVNLAGLRVGTKLAYQWYPFLLYCSILHFVHRWRELGYVPLYGTICTLDRLQTVLRITTNLTRAKGGARIRTMTLPFYVDMKKGRGARHVLDELALPA